MNKGILFLGILLAGCTQQATEIGVVDPGTGTSAGDPQLDLYRLALNSNEDTCANGGEIAEIGGWTNRVAFYGTDGSLSSCQTIDQGGKPGVTYFETDSAKTLLLHCARRPPLRVRKIELRLNDSIDENVLSVITCDSRRENFQFDPDSGPSAPRWLTVGAQTLGWEGRGREPVLIADVESLFEDLSRMLSQFWGNGSAVTGPPQTEGTELFWD